jgi:hypothetical protein
MSPTVSNSTFTNNTCIVTVAGDTSYGGAVAVDTNSSLTISGRVTHRYSILTLHGTKQFGWPLITNVQNYTVLRAVVQICVYNLFAVCFI